MALPYRAALWGSVPDLLDSVEYGELFALVDQTRAERTGQDSRFDRKGIVYVLDALEHAGKIRAEADRLIVRLILDSREAGKTWDQIGQSLGMTRQGVHLIVKRSQAVKK